MKVNGNLPQAENCSGSKNSGLKIQSEPQGKQRVSMTTISWSVLFRKVIAVYSEHHTKPIFTLCGQNAELLNVSFKHLKQCGVSCRGFELVPLTILGSLNQAGSVSEGGGG
jgi:hypothetical protein